MLAGGNLHQSTSEYPGQVVHISLMEFNFHGSILLLKLARQIKSAHTDFFVGSRRLVVVMVVNFHQLAWVGLHTTSSVHC